jgi:hypothetical protein
MCPWFPESGCWSVSSCYGLDLAVVEFVFDRGEHAEGRVAPPAVAVDLEVFEDRVGELDGIFQRWRLVSSVCMRPRNDSIMALS